MVRPSDRAESPRNKTLAQNADEIVVAASGNIYVAPVGTALPTTADDALNGSFVQLGFASEDGVTFTDSTEYEDVPAWQSFYPVRKIPSTKESMAEFTLLQWNVNTIPLAFQGGAWSGGGATAEMQVVVLTGFSGTDNFHLTYGGNESANIVRGTNYDAAGVKAAIEGISGVTFTVEVLNLTDEGFIVQWNETGTRTALSVTNPTGVTGVVGTLVEGAAAAGSDYIYSPPLPGEDIDYRSMVVEWSDGSRDNRIVIERGMVSGEVEVDLTRTAAAGLPISFSALPASGSDLPWQFLSNDPAMA